MTWAKLDDGLPENPKVQALSDKSFRLYITGLTYSSRNLTDGYLNDIGYKVCAVLCRSTKRNAEELVEVGLWHRSGTGYAINDFLEFNPPAEEVKEERRKARERMRALRQLRKDKPPPGSPERSPEHSPERSPARSGTPTRPDPSSSSNGVEGTEQERPSNEEVEGSEWHAAKLFLALSEPHRTPHVRQMVLGYSGRLPEASFVSVMQSLEKNRRSIRNEAKWVQKALDTQVRERSEAA